MWQEHLESLGEEQTGVRTVAPFPLERTASRFSGRGSTQGGADVSGQTVSPVGGNSEQHHRPLLHWVTPLTFPVRHAGCPVSLQQCVLTWWPQVCVCMSCVLPVGVSATVKR